MAQPAWSTGAGYEPYVGRWSRLVAEKFLAWLGVSPSARWLDVGCGTGAVSQTILDLGSPREVVGVDTSEGFIDYVRRQVSDPRARFESGDAQALSFETGAFDASVAGLALNFFPDPGRGVREMARATRPGGTVGFYVWDYAGQMQMMRCFWDAAVTLDVDAKELDEGNRFGSLCKPSALTDLLSGSGLSGIRNRAIEVHTSFRDFDDFWSPFLGGQGPAPAYAVSLGEDARAKLRDRVRSALPVAPNGAIDLIARAWAVAGLRPSTY